MPDEHAFVSASAAYRWSRCVMSVTFSQQFPDTGSPYAAEGTLAHSIAELKLNKQFTPMPPSEYKRKIEALKADPLYQDEMDGFTDRYVEEILKICHALPTRPYVVAEKKLDLSHIIPEGFGTADCVVLHGDTLHIFDLKYGKGVPVSAEENPQLRLYALGAVREYSMLYDIRRVVTHIIQPRLDNMSSEELSTEELTAWGETIKPLAEMAYRGEGDFCAGDWCRFCKGKNHCRARTAAMLELEQPKERMERGEVLTDEEIGSILLRAQTLENWVKGLKEYAFQKISTGGNIPGWKLVEGGGGKRFISDVDKAFAVLTSSGYEEAVLYAREPIGVPALEKLCGKKKLTELIGSYITKPAGKPTLAPVSDKRKALSKKKLEEMFKED